jgi:hypothetical protein
MKSRSSDRLYPGVPSGLISLCLIFFECSQMLGIALSTQPSSATETVRPKALVVLSKAAVGATSAIGSVA